ncbi:sigma 54-interacting transcriptional regulator [Bacillus sp. FJAT-27245]|uniref:sigma 54-interacting transcriptional regulator n=1 Tax=Bacillus sp. FJAT-27245 TaxID=1684144 RepID=UPI0006A7AE2F|nr:sigma 54-interacting transcriptional regulator [Bacillus sp. FJAT-27245]
MGKKNVHIIAIQEKYLSEISKQIIEVLGDEIILTPCPLKELRPDTVKKGDIVLLSNNMIKGIVTQFIPAECPLIVAKRDLNFVNAKAIINLPESKKILVVNDTKVNTDETVQSLKQTIFEHEYIAYRPDEPIPPSIDYILTPGEKELLPSGLPNVIDIGPRLLDIETFYELVELAGLRNDQLQILKRYIKSLVSLSLNNNGYNETDDKNVKDIRNVAAYHFKDVVAISESMKETLELAKRYSLIHGPIHIRGNEGTGKSMLAQAIHNGSASEASPFIAFNCKSKSLDMLEKELFGYEGGDRTSLGLFEVTKNGTVYLEHINEMPMPIQQKVFKALEEKLFIRVGGTNPVPFMCRLITSSNQHLGELAEKGIFLPALAQELRLTLCVPPLIERKDDLLALIDDFKRRLDKRNVTISQEVMDELINYDWPGNVKELYNVITYLLFLDDGPIRVDHLPLSIRFKDRRGNLISSLQPQQDFDDVIRKIESHGFLEESVEVLRIFVEGKKTRNSFGRATVKKLLANKEMILSEQQLRMRMEILHQLGLLNVRQGRAGSTISRKGEEFLSFLDQTEAETAE